MKKLYIKFGLLLGIITVQDLSAKIRKQLVPRCHKHKAICNRKRQYKDGIVHPNYPEHITHTKYHRGCWITYCDNNFTASVFRFDTQREAAKFLADKTGENITRNDIYNAMRWRDGILGWGSRVIAKVSYDKP